jgi:cell division protein FtsB
MATSNNSSYNNCINQLHARYDSRGVAANASKEAANIPNAYLVARMNKNNVTDKYRNGEFNGQKYMTTGDFLKYYNNRKSPDIPAPIRQASSKTKEFKKPSVTVPGVKAEPIVKNVRKDVVATSKTAARPIKKIDSQADTIVMPAQKSTKKIKGRVSALFAKWFPAEDKATKVAGAKKNVPVAMIGLLISLSVAMTMIVSTTVMASNSQADVSNIKTEIKLLEKENDMLEEEIVKREDLEMIKAYATEKLGMIRQDYVSSVYDNVSAEDSINAEEQENGNMSAILSAMFGN